MTFKLTRNVYKSLADDCTCCDYTFEIWMHNFIISFSPEMHSFYICCFLPKKKKKKPDLCSRCDSYSGLKWLGISVLLSIPMKVCTTWHPHKIQEHSCFSSGGFTFERNSFEKLSTKGKLFLCFLQPHCLVQYLHLHRRTNIYTSWCFIHKFNWNSSSAHRAFMLFIWI